MMNMSRSSPLKSWPQTKQTYRHTHDYKANWPNSWPAQWQCFGTKFIYNI